MVFGIIELIFIGIFFILMVIGTALDRRHRESPKWWVLGLGLAAAIVYFWGELDFSSMWAAVQEWSFWKPFATYLIAGLIYSAFEFVLSVRKMARSHASSWNKFIAGVDTKFYLTSDGGERAVVESNWVVNRDGKYFLRTNGRGSNDRDGEVLKEVEKVSISYRDIFKKAQAVDASDLDKERAERLLAAYLGRDEYRLSDLKKDFVEVGLNEITYDVEPIVNRARLSAFIGAWTFLWPAYAVSLVLGDFLVEVFRVIGDFFSKIGGRFVRFTFADVFKV